MEWASKQYVYCVFRLRIVPHCPSRAFHSLYYPWEIVEGLLVVYYVFRYFDTIPNSFSAATKVLSDSASVVHTQEWLWRRDFCERA